MPVPLIDKDEALWVACHRLQQDPRWVAGLLQDEDPATRPMLLAYGPVARRNQFQAMLYARAAEHAFGVLPLQHLELFERIPSVTPVLCHLHWVHELTARAADRAAADAGVAQWRRLLGQLKAQGHRIAWTVHNVLPHESHWPEHDIEVHRMVAEAADIVHVMTHASRELCAPYYAWPAARELYVPHPSYEGAQTDWIDRPQARATLGIAPDEFVFLSFGAVLPYKGHARVMRVFDQLAAGAGRPVRWLVAGQASHAGLLRELRTWAATRPNVTLDIRPVPNEDLQEHFRAADVALCPYERTLNSGAALMAASFGVPIIGPRTGGFVDNLGEDCALLFDPGSDEALLTVMRDALAQPLAAKAAAGRELSRRLAAGEVSRRFFTALRARLAQEQGQGA